MARLMAYSLDHETLQRCFISLVDGIEGRLIVFEKAEKHEMNNCCCQYLTIHKMFTLSKLIDLHCCSTFWIPANYLYALRESSATRVRRM